MTLSHTIGRVLMVCGTVSGVAPTGRRGHEMYTLCSATRTRTWNT